MLINGEEQIIFHNQFLTGFPFSDPVYNFLIDSLGQNRE